MSAPQFRVARRLRRLAETVDRMHPDELKALEEYLEAFRWEAQARWPSPPRPMTKPRTERTAR